MADTNVILRSSDDETVTVSLKVAQMSSKISTKLQEIGVPQDGVVPTIVLTSVRGEILRLVVAWCESNKNSTASTVLDVADRDSPTPYAIPAKDALLLEVDLPLLYDLITVAESLEIQGLHNACLKVLANKIKGQTPEQIRQTFEIAADLEPVEEDLMRLEANWCKEAPREGEEPQEQQ